MMKVQFREVVSNTRFNDSVIMHTTSTITEFYRILNNVAFATIACAATNIIPIRPNSFLADSPDEDNIRYSIHI